MAIKEVPEVGYVIGQAPHDDEVQRLRLQAQTGFNAYSAAFVRLVVQTLRRWYSS